MENTGLSEPPEGVVTGDSVPRENEEVGAEESRIQEMVGIMKTKEAYRRKSDSELREIAKEKLL